MPPVASTFFWQDGRYGVTGGVLVALSSAAWVYGLLGVWEHLHAWLPKLATVGLLMTLLGQMFGGIAFGLQGFFEGIFGISVPRITGGRRRVPDGFVARPLGTRFEDVSCCRWSCWQVPFGQPSCRDY